MDGFVATVGESLAQPSELRKAVAAGVRAFRLNLGRRSPEKHLRVAVRLRDIDADVRLFVDLPGPGKARIVSSSYLALGVGTTFALTARGIKGPRGLPAHSVDSVGFLRRLRERDVIRTGDIECKVEETWRCGVTCVADGDGLIGFGKPVRMVSQSLPFNELDGRDVDLLSTVEQLEPDYLALSFAEQAGVIWDLRDRVADRTIRLLAKIETMRGLINADQLARDADGLMLGRDDLSLRVSSGGMSEVAEELATVARRHGKEFVAASGYFSSVVSDTSTSASDQQALRAAERYADWVVSDETAFAKRPFDVIDMARSLGWTNGGG